MRHVPWLRTSFIAMLIGATIVACSTGGGPASPSPAGVQATPTAALPALSPGAGASQPAATAPSASPSAPPVASFTAPPSSPTPASSTLPGGPAPTELIGTWSRLQGSSNYTPTVLVVRDTGFTIRAYGTQGSGSLVVNGDEIDFFNSGPCPGPVGRYQWTLTGGTLHFAALNADPCDRKGFLANQSYTRASQ